jgi:hypothetical protein
MCECRDCGPRPDVLIGKPEQCVPEQIREYHGEAMEHPCTRVCHDRAGDEDE